MSFTLSISDINFIKPLFRYLNIFLITPWYDFKKNAFYKTHLSKSYGCILIFEKLFWILIVNLRFNLTTVSLTHELISVDGIQFMWVIIILLRPLLLVLKSTSWNLTKWKILITNLKYVDFKLRNVGRRATLLDNFYLKFVIEQLIFGIYAAYQLLTWSDTFGLSRLEALYVGPGLDLYREYLVVLLMNLLINCLTKRYKDLNKMLGKSFTSFRILREMSTMTQIYRILGETIDAFNDIFGYQMILTLFNFGLGIIGCLNYSLVTFINLTDYMYYRFLISNILTMVFVTYNFLMIVLPMHSTMQEAKNFIDVCYKLREQFSEGSKESEALTKSIDSSKNFFREFNASGFFNINKGIIFSLIGNVATYYIISIQLNESHVQMQKAPTDL